jgi:hypothetical protein
MGGVSFVEALVDKAEARSATGWFLAAITIALLVLTSFDALAGESDVDVVHARMEGDVGH